MLQKAFVVHEYNPVVSDFIDMINIAGKSQINCNSTLLELIITTKV